MSAHFLVSSVWYGGTTPLI